MLQAFLRVLYTVNSNPQYILAKSSSQVPAITCSEATVENEAIHARAPLKACLAVICDSSPELLQDHTRDFSLYVLDPLEAQPLPTSLPHARHDTNSPRGVAVALGLMSWALGSQDSSDVLVTGTIIPHTPPALEVVFALRETKRIPKPVFHAYPSFGAIPVPGSSQPQNHQNPSQVAGTNWFQGPQTLTRSADFPEFYIGPPRRARGRPEGSTSSKSRATSQTSVSSLPGPSSSNVPESRTGSMQECKGKSKQKTKSRLPRPPPTFSPFISAPLTREAVTARPGSTTTGTPAFYHQSYTSGQSQMQSQPYLLSTHNPLLALLSAISHTPSGDTAPNTTPEQQAALVSALQGLLATNPHLLQLAMTNFVASSGEQANDEKARQNGSDADDKHDDGDSDVVILDSSTIDAAAFRKRSTRQLAKSDRDPSAPATNQESPMPSRQGTDSSSLPASTPSVTLESTPTISSEVQTPILKTPIEWGSITPSYTLDMPATPTPSRARKRKLGEYIQGQSRSSTSPPSPSPFLARSSGRTFTARQVQSSPTGGARSAALPSMRLPSMLGSMRTLATSGSHQQTNSPGPSTHGYPISSATNKSGSQSITSTSGPSKPNYREVPDGPLNDIASDATSLKRRCTLSEFMAEHEARKNAKVRKRFSSGRRLGGDAPANTSHAAPPRSAKLLSVPRNAQSSPPRPLFRSDSAPSSLPVAALSAVIPNPAVSSTPACAAPLTFSSTVVSTKNPLKHFVLPAWARTSTAMLPRLSEEALARQRVEQETKKARTSLKRREAAKAKRKRLLDVEHPLKESSDEDDEAVANDATLRTLHSSSSDTRSGPLPPPPLLSLPVFASDAVEPISSSPPRSSRQPTSLVIPSTPPRKPASLGPGSVPHPTPSKSGSSSLFTPSGPNTGSLFTPSTPSVTQSLVTYTPRSPTVLRRSSTKKSPRKSAPLTPWTPKGAGGKQNHSPRSLYDGRNPPLVSPLNLVTRTPQTQTSMGTRAFLLPPPSPCALRTLHIPKRAQSKLIPTGVEDCGSIKQESPSNVESKNCKKEDILVYKLDCELLEKDTPIMDAGQATSGPRDIVSDSDTSQAEEEYVSSPLPPSSPPPTSVCSSPVNHAVVVPDSDIPLPSASDFGGLRDPAPALADPGWLSDDARTASGDLLTDSETNAWFTETEAWFTDSEAIFGDVSSLPQSSSASASWLSDGADVDTDNEFWGGMNNSSQGQEQGWKQEQDQAQDGGFNAVAFERAFPALVARGAGTEEMAVESEFWSSMQPLWQGGDKVEQDIQALLGDFVGT